MAPTVGRSFLRSLTAAGRESKPDAEAKSPKDSNREAQPRVKDHRVDKDRSEKGVRDKHEKADASDLAKTPRASDVKSPRKSKQDGRRKAEGIPHAPTTPKRDGYHTDASWIPRSRTPVKDPQCLASQASLAGLLDFSPRNSLKGPKDPLKKKKAASRDACSAVTSEGIAGSPRTPIDAHEAGKAPQPNPEKSLLSPGAPKNLMIRARSFGPGAPSPGTPATPEGAAMPPKGPGKSFARVTSAHTDLGSGKPGRPFFSSQGAEPDSFSLDGTSSTDSTPAKHLAPKLHAPRASWSEAGPLALAHSGEGSEPESARLAAELDSLRRQCREAELACAEAQSARADAETALAVVKTSRVEAESAKAEAESARAEAESARAEAESARAEADSARAKAESARAEAELALAKAEFALVEAASATQQAEQLRQAAESALAEEHDARRCAEVALEGAMAEFGTREAALRETTNAALTKVEAVLAEKAELEAAIASLSIESVAVKELEAGCRELNHKLGAQVEAMSNEKDQVERQLRVSERELEETKSRVVALEGRFKDLGAEVQPGTCSGAGDCQMGAEGSRPDTENKALSAPAEAGAEGVERGPLKHWAIEGNPGVAGAASGDKGVAKAEACSATQTGVDAEGAAKRGEVPGAAEGGSEEAGALAQRSTHVTVEELLREKAELEERMEKAITEALTWVDRSEALEARLAEEEARLAEQARMWEHRLEVEEKRWAAQRLSLETQAEGRLQLILELQQSVSQLKVGMFQLKEDSEAAERSLAAKVAALEDEKATLCEESAYMLSKFRAGVEAFDVERKEWEEERGVLQMLRMGAQELRSEHAGAMRAMAKADRLEEQLDAAEAARAALAEEVAVMQEIMREKAAAFQVEIWSLQQKIRELERDRVLESGGEGVAGQEESREAGGGSLSDGSLCGEGGLAVPFRAQVAQDTCKGATSVPLAGCEPGALEDTAAEGGGAAEGKEEQAAGPIFAAEPGLADRAGQAVVELATPGLGGELAEGNNHAAESAGKRARRLAELEEAQQELLAQVNGLKLQNGALKEALAAVTSSGAQVQGAGGSAPAVESGQASTAAGGIGGGRCGKDQQPWNLSLLSFLPRNFQPGFSSESDGKNAGNNAKDARGCSLSQCEGEECDEHQPRSSTTCAEWECRRFAASSATSSSCDLGSEAELRVPSTGSGDSSTSLVSSSVGQEEQGWAALVAALQRELHDLRRKCSELEQGAGQESELSC